VHSVADSGNQVLLLIGRTRARREETEEHQFGFGAERYVYAFIVAVVLFVVGAIFSLYEGINRIIHPEKVLSPAVAFTVLAVAIALEAFSFRTAISQSNKSRGPATWSAFIRHAKAPELPIVLLEDFAALIGLGFALCAVTVSTVTGDGRWDGAGSIAIGVLLGCVAAVLAVEMKSLLIGESASPEVQRAIVAAIEQAPQIEQVIHLRTLHVGPDSLLVGAKVAVKPGELAEDIAAAIDAAERRIRAQVPIAGLIYVEPDLFEAARQDRADPAVRAVSAARGRRAPGASGGSPAAGAQPSGGSSAAGAPDRPDEPSALLPVGHRAGNALDVCRGPRCRSASPYHGQQVALLERSDDGPQVQGDQPGRPAVQVDVASENLRPAPAERLPDRHVGHHVQAVPGAGQDRQGRPVDEY
jgi:cation diffusion facilitator family transporter